MIYEQCLQLRRAVWLKSCIHCFSIAEEAVAFGLRRESRKTNNAPGRLTKLVPAPNSTENKTALDGATPIEARSPTAATSRVPHAIKRNAVYSVFEFAPCFIVSHTLTASSATPLGALGLETIR